MTVSQFGYVVGLALLVPVGDLRERRGLITLTLAITAGGLAVAAAAPGFAVFGAALGVVGVTSTVAQVIVPMASSLAADARARPGRGHCHERAADRDPASRVPSAA